MKNPNAKFHAPEHDHRYEQAVNEHDDREAGKHANSWWITYIPEPLESEKPAAPAQAQHSPLPWTAHKYPDCKTWTVASATSVASKLTEANAKFIVRACNNAQRLADAAKQVERDWNITRRKHLPSSMAKLRVALAEWSKQK